ncbi:hypothetical protein LTR10_014368 [Elasticomyces elasticus]|uniref:Rhodopsin domain-containing protein n=1 Tax=Exophiala sideris TaxID=1016849 RepID=A0ABR0J0F9_9EURO|nr:hypothetical protein LTR10_014368 [Elasticomyces elasticus]KAK5023719.1 hypothetical protein LTS07_009227 [Exophiala sideris]KAK5029718.1 hypothetical protein LTR13_008638 [Exophiala sideris]KAK5053508.1 hypothetical protein LTR69_009466 [Exophiala sideris]KAK5179266.1 hypothetical protein LTR44_008420 [Eurotiomycetes sp. CCFEE 6388]
MATLGGDNRFSPITPDDHAGSIWIATILCLIYSVITLTLRGHLRWKMYGMDDYLALAATVMQVGEVAAIMVGLNHGLGKTEHLLRHGELQEASRATFAGQILFILSLTCAKASTLYLMMRLFNLSGPKANNQTRSRIFYWVGIGVLAGMALWGLLSVVALSVDCSTRHLIEGNASQCSRQFLRWQLITAFDVATECILVLLSVFIVLPVQISFMLKCQPYGLAALSIIHLKYISEYTTSKNPGIALVPALVLQQVELCWSLIAATIPNLKSFVKSFGSGFGIQLDPTLTQGAYGSGRYKDTNGYEMGSVPGKGSSKSRSGNRSYNEIEHQNPIPHQAQDDDKIRRDQESIDSAGSQDHIIRKDVQWDIHYETTERNMA